MSFTSRVSTVDALLFAGALLIVGAGFTLVFVSVDTGPPAAEWADPSAQSTASSSHVQSMPGTVPALSSGVLTGNIFDGVPGHSGTSITPMSWPSSGASASAGQTSRGMGFSSHAETAPFTFGPGATSTGASSTGASRGSGASADPGGWAGALASSSGELRSLERQVGAIERHLSRRSGGAAGAQTMQGDEQLADGFGTALLGPRMHNEDEAPLPSDPLDPNPPLPPDPVPVDGGLALLLAAGGLYGARRLQHSG